MSEQPPQERPPEEELPEEQLSGTLMGALGKVARGLSDLGSALFGGGLVTIVVGGVVYLLVEDLRVAAQIILIIGASLLLVGFILSWPSVRALVGARRGRFSVNAVVMVLSFLGIAAVGNFLAFEHIIRIDVTATNRFTLAERTKNLLSDLPEPVEARAYFVRDSVRLPPEQIAFLDRVEDVLREFDARSGKFSYKVIDPDREPERANKDGVDQYGTIALEAKESGRIHLIVPSQFLEQEFVTGLLIVTGVEQKKIYFLKGHQERSTLDPEGTGGFGQVALTPFGLIGDNYEVLSFDMLQETKVPEDATVVVIAGPTKSMLEGEEEALDEYLRGGGIMLVLADPEIHEDFRSFLRKWGVEVEQGYIVDRERFLEGAPRSTFLSQSQYRFITDLSVQVLQDYYGPNTAALVTNLALSLIEISNDLDRTFFPGVASLRPTEAVAFHPQLELLSEEDVMAPGGTLIGAALGVTSPDSWLIDDPLRTDPDPELDRQGPFFPAIGIMAAVGLVAGQSPSCSQEEIACLLVIGDSDFAANENFYLASNGDFFLNSVNWLAGDVALASIRPKPLGFRPFNLDENQRDFVRFSSWLLLPTAMALLAGVAWWRRR